MPKKTVSAGRQALWHDVICRIEYIHPSTTGQQHVINAQATKAAADLAGLNVLHMINEPTAAALSFGCAASKQWCPPAKCGFGDVQDMP
jgi:Hsp70 protein